MSYSDEPALADLGFLNASIRYSCGPLLHFLVELYLAHGDNDANVTGIWREIVRRARLGQKEYDLSTFVSVSGDPDLLDRPAIAAILSTAGPERWNAVVDEMRRHGAGRNIDPIRHCELVASSCLF